MIRLENLVITSSGSNTAIFRDMLKAVKKFKEVKNEGKTLIYTANLGSWQCSGSGKRKRPLSSVILHDGVGETLLADIKDFIDSAEWYTEFGVPYRRGYLLHGPPGTGENVFHQRHRGTFRLECLHFEPERQNFDGMWNDRLID